MIKFVLSTRESIMAMKPEFGYNGFGEFLFYRTYSRNETWGELVVRVIEGTFSIRKDHYIKNGILWDESFWQIYAYHMAVSMFQMKWLPPGRGLWMMGTEFMYTRGSMALFNCAFTRIGSGSMDNDLHWLMDCLMLGVGVGFEPVRDENFSLRIGKGRIDYSISDDREGWCDSVKHLISHYIHGYPYPVFDYSLIRPAGLPIKGFGGISSGPEPLKELHEKIEEFFEMYKVNSWYDEVMLKADIANCIGCMVVSGNIRRSAEIMCGPIDDVIDMKDYTKYPHRAMHGWMSNNTTMLSTDEDFMRLDEIAARIKNNGEPGVANLRNFSKGRIRGFGMGEVGDKAIGLNPCGEITLEDKELCNLAETLPARCVSVMDWLKACEYATMYASTVTLLPTHRVESNAVILRNRRIGVSITGMANWNINTTELISALRDGYKVVRDINKWANGEAGIPESIKVTTIKPSGTIPKLAGLCSGFQYPTFGLTLRRVRVAQNSKIHKILVEAGVPYEKDLVSSNTDVFEWPIDQSQGGRIRPATKVSIWEQAMMLVILQREWADNAVSNTIYFKPEWNLIRKVSIYDREVLEEYGLEEVDDNNGLYKAVVEYDSLKIYERDPDHEEDQVERVLAAIMPVVKSVSMLPHSSTGVYPQSPEEGLTLEEYNKRLEELVPIQWGKVDESVGEKYCSNEGCVI